MTMIKHKDVLVGELQDLTEEIKLLTPTDTPLTTLLLGAGKVRQANDITVSWREKELNNQRGTLIVEGAEAGTPIRSTRTMKSNLCQIMEKVTSVSGTMRALNPKGIGDEFTTEVQDRLIELKRDMEYYFIQGTKAVEDGGTPRQMNGLLNLIHADNVVDVDAVGRVDNKGKLEEADLEDAMQLIWNAGAHGDCYMFVNAKEKRIINGILKNGANTRMYAEAGDNVLGVKVQRVETDFGTINIVLNRHMPTGQALIIDLAEVEIAELRPTFYEELAKTGDYTKGHVVNESTIKLLNSKAGAKIIGIAK